MKAPRYATSRRKACIQCVSAKTKCDRVAESCRRCSRRGLSCTYNSARSTEKQAGNVVSQAPVSCAANPKGHTVPITVTSENTCTRTSTISSAARSDSAIDLLQLKDRIQGCFHEAEPGVRTAPSGHSSAVAHTHTAAASLNFSDLELVCPIDASAISNRWLSKYVHDDGQQLKRYPKVITKFIFNVLNSYANLVGNGRGIPPFVHSSHLEAIHMKAVLGSCLTMSHSPEELQEHDKATVVSSMQLEMNRLYENRDQQDDATLLATFQAYLIFSMILFFKYGLSTLEFLRQAMMNLQTLASLSSENGLVCVVDQEKKRPRWESWTVAEAKRRTLYTMYLFDSLISARDDMPVYLGTELSGLPASASKSTWHAKTHQEWAPAYDSSVQEREAQGLRIDDLWPIPEDLDESEIFNRHHRVDRWLEDVDEFGMMLYTVTSCTHDI